MSNLTSIIKAFLDAENKRDWQTWSSFLHPDIEYKLIGSEKIIKGKEAYIRHMQEVYSELSDWYFNIVHLLFKESTVMVEFNGRGHFTGMYQDKKYAKIPLHLSAVCIFVIKDNLIITIQEYWDKTGFEKQLKK
ncbi:nuclear transport factor 2 family protein [Candidatus Woesearchaeota archaeon]|nr:nuclear transport factor 2 family protein [Candidatus Woesearchaeota archaeon]